MSDSIEEQVLQLVQELDRAQAKNLPTLPLLRDATRVWSVQDAESVAAHYAKLLRSFPNEYSQACDWGEPEEQERLLSDLVSIGDLNGKKILDLGCGPGGLVDLLQRKGIRTSAYVGVDAHAGLLQLARQRFPEFDWIQADCFDASVPWTERLSMGRFDYVIASGIFGVRPRQWSAKEFNSLLLEVLERFFSLANLGLAFNVIPENYPILRNALQMKNDTDSICYHRLDRLQLVQACKNRLNQCQVKTLPANLERLLVQFPVFLIRDPD